VQVYGVAFLNTSQGLDGQEWDSSSSSGILCWQPKPAHDQSLCANMTLISFPTGFADFTSPEGKAQAPPQKQGPYYKPSHSFHV
jgi:hypothetical protein